MSAVAGTFDDFVREHWDYAVRNVHFYLEQGNLYWIDPGEVLSDVFYNLGRRWNTSVRNPNKGLICQQIFYAVGSMLRKRKAYEKFITEDEGLVNRATTEQPEVTDSIFEQELNDEFEAAVSLLPEHHRDALFLKKEGYRRAEIMELTGTAHGGTYWRRLNGGIAALIELTEEQPERFAYLNEALMQRNGG